VKSYEITSIICFLISSITFICGAIWLKSTVTFLSRAVSVTGKIVRQVEDTDCELKSRSGNFLDKPSYSAYQPIVKYEIRGEAKEAGLSDRSAKGYEIGSSVELLVDLNAPDEPESKGAFIWFGPIALISISAVFGLVGFVGSFIN